MRIEEEGAVEMDCPTCGAIAETGAQFCASCGTTLTGAGTVESPPVTPRSGVADPELYAGFWRRVAAFLIDYVIVLGAFAIVGLVVAQGPLVRHLVVPLACVSLVTTFWLYPALMESSAYQGTLGKRALGIKVTDYAGRRIGFGRATARAFGRFLSGVILNVGFLMAAFTRRRQALHDFTTNTLVVKRTTSTEQIASTPAGRHVPAWAMTSLAALGAFLFLGPVTYEGVPTYQNHVAQWQIMDGFEAALPHKEAILEAAGRGLTWEDMDSERLGLPTTVESPYVEAIAVDRGAIQITFGKDASEGIRGSTVTLTPGINERDNLVWTCGLAAPTGVQHALENHADYTTVESRYLPVFCRAE